MRFPCHIIVALLACIGSAAAAETVQDEQLWINLTAMGPIDGRLVYFAEVQPRIGEGVSRLSQLLIRPAIGWKLTPNLTVYQGYTHVALPIAGGADRNEDRSFQQISWTIGRIGRGELQSRSRLEQRWLSNGTDIGWRLRQMLRLKWPIDNSNGSSGGIAALGWVEGFVALNSTDWGARRGFDQGRAFVGAELPLRGRSTIELGYINQTIDQPAGGIRMNHVASISLFVRH